MPQVPITEDVALWCQDLGEGPAVVLVHGGCMSHRVWESQIYALLESGYRVIAPDLRGHGNSDKPVSSYTADMYANDIAALADALRIEEFALVGWSLGATIAVTFAKSHGDRLRKLLLVSSNIFERIATSNEDAEDRLPLDKMVANQRRNRPQGMERFVSGMFGPNPNEWTVRWLWSIGMQTPMRVAIETLEIYAEPDTKALRETMVELEVPGAVFHGAHDRSAALDDAQYIAAELLSNGTFVPFQNSGHVPFLEEPTRFDDKLLAFLDG